MRHLFNKKFFLLIPLLIAIPVSVFLVQRQQEIRKKAAESPITQATLNDYWQGKAEWKAYRKLTMANTGWDFSYQGGSNIEIVGNTWYLFSGSSLGGIQVRKSIDKGATWSASVDIIIPTKGKAWETWASDGDAYYNAAENRWHYLFQCLAPGSTWNGCHVVRDGSDPMGPFTEIHANPVITYKSLWQKICDNPNDDCVKIPEGVNLVQDSGTFDIFNYDGTYYYVSFHGAYYAAGYSVGFRGIAKTKDFVNWIAGDQNQGVPADAILDKDDAAGWREQWHVGGPIGFGAGSILFDNGYYYLISEAADMSLGCTAGQNWDWGLFRSNSLLNTHWEQFPLGNPILYSSNKVLESNGRSFGCNPAYGKLFKDPLTNQIYLHYSRSSLDPAYIGLYIYELVPSSNLLKNGDLWKCNTEDWKIFPIGPTLLQAGRNPYKSYEGTCYLMADCGADTCQAGQSIYQDIDVSNISSRNVAYGGKFATNSDTGTLNLTIFESDTGSNIINFHRSRLNPTPSYQSFKNEVVLDSRTKKIRFQLYLESPHTFKADEMFFETLQALSTPPPSPTATPTPEPIATPTPIPSNTPTPTPTPIPQPGKADLIFRLKFQGISTQKPNQNVRIILKQDGQEKYRFENTGIVADQNGVYSGKIMNINPGTYDVFIKGRAHLQKKFPQIILTEGENTQDLTSTELLAGDINQDNVINAQDIALIVQDYRPHTPPNSPADFNLDDQVNAQDIRFVIENYRLSGDE